jgi:excisionase family DNA binding protein
MRKDVDYSKHADPPSQMSPGAAAVWLGCSRAMIYKLYRAGELQGYKVGRATRIYTDSLRAYQEAHHGAPPPVAGTVPATGKRPVRKLRAVPVKLRRHLD